VSGLVEWLKEHDLYHLGGAFFLLIVCFCALAVAAIGRDALAGTPFTDLANHLRPPRNNG